MKKLVILILFLILATYLNLGPQLVRSEHGEDKIAHVAFYTILEMVFFWIMGKFSLAIVSVAATLYEYLQKFSPGRNSNAYDLLASLSGVLLGYYIFLGFNKLLGRKRDADTPRETRQH